VGFLPSPHHTWALASFLPSPGIPDFHHLQRDASERERKEDPPHYTLPPSLRLGYAILSPLSTIRATCTGLLGDKILIFLHLKYEIVHKCICSK